MLEARCFGGLSKKEKQLAGEGWGFIYGERLIKIEFELGLEE